MKYQDFKELDLSHTLCLSEGKISIKDDVENSITIDNIDYSIKEFGHKGGNSILLELFETQEESEIASNVIKICKYTLPNRENKFKPIHRRFIREVESLVKCKNNQYEDVIQIVNYGKLKVEGPNGSRHNFLYYIMEYASTDLKTYLELNNLDKLTRVSLCLELSYAIKKLHSLGIYHRDIKPDNILYANGRWKIADLGLVGFRNEDIYIDRKGEFIGPRGWISPEAMNKFLTEKVDHFNYDCIIDEQSDIFQLGKLFWYLIQGNVPIGCIKSYDFKEPNNELFSLIRFMLNHSKTKRPLSIDKVIRDLKTQHDKLLLA